MSSIQCFNAFASQLTEQEELKILEHHFTLWYQIFSDCKLVSEALFKKNSEFCRAFTGIPNPLFNSVIGFPKSKHEWDDCIEEQLKYFQQARIPFNWCLDKKYDSEIKNKLLEYRFQYVGVFRGMIAPIDVSNLPPELSAACIIEQITDEESIVEFNHLVCDTFALQGLSKEMSTKAMLKIFNQKEIKMFHWAVKVKGKIAATLTSFIDQGAVSFWNGATLPQFRRQGFCKALACAATRHAASLDCNVGLTYLMADAMALGISEEMRYQAKWCFDVYFSPAN